MIKGMIFVNNTSSKKEYLKIVFVTTIFVISVLLTIFSPNFYEGVFKRIVTISGFTYAYYKFILSNSTHAFKFYQKIKATVINPSTQWSYTSYLKMDNPIDSDAAQNMFNHLVRNKSKYKSFKNMNIEKHFSAGKSFIFDLGLTTVTIMVVDDDRYKISCTANIGYRKSSEFIQNQLEIIGTELAKADENSITDINYSVKIIFENENPFYCLFVKNFELSKTIPFTLKYEIDSIHFLIDNHSIEFTTNDSQDIKKIANDYLVIS